MTSAVAILTYRRWPALKTTLAGLQLHCPGIPIAVFEDCGNRDATSGFLAVGPARRRNELMADQYLNDGYVAFLGRVNLGVAGNSNRGIKWFMDGHWDHLCLMNDDLHVLGNFVNFYAQAHRDLGVGFFCFNDFWESETHRWVTARSRGYRLKIFPRMTGIMMSMTRQVVEKIGYFDARFGHFGNEHCDYTNRARFAGEIKLDGQDQSCIDVEPTLPDGKAGPPVLKHQDVATSVTGAERKKADEESVVCMQQAAARYHYEHYYRPFCLVRPKVVGGINQQGILFDEIPGYRLVNVCS